LLHNILDEPLFDIWKKKKKKTKQKQKQKKRQQ